MSTHVLHMTRLHAKRPLLVELRVINGPFEGGCRLQSGGGGDVLHPESKQQTTPAAPRDALECVAALARTREDRQNCVRFAYLGPQVDRLHVLELKRDVE